MRFPNRFDTNWPVQSLKHARSLKFWIEVEEGLYCLCSENKGVDQLHAYRKAGLRLCFRICELLVFSCDGSLSNGLEQEILQFNPFLMNGFSHHYHLGVSTFILRDIRSDFKILFICFLISLSKQNSLRR